MVQVRLYANRSHLGFSDTSSVPSAQVCFLWACLPACPHAAALLILGSDTPAVQQRTQRLLALLHTLHGVMHYVLTSNRAKPLCLLYCFICLVRQDLELTPEQLASGEQIPLKWVRLPSQGMRDA